MADFLSQKVEINQVISAKIEHQQQNSLDKFTEVGRLVKEALNGVQKEEFFANKRDLQVYFYDKEENET